ncbi:unnamed protein product, partial [Mesorhabditis belari]|uniref:Uncharacterized protein n=1 Tax=Mesorhabditis belari TaxID=2138241 RepID=A0AAF3EVX9_9BILA
MLLGIDRISMIGSEPRSALLSLEWLIGLLAAAENVNKFVYAIVHSLSTMCKLILVIRCSPPLRNSLYALVGYLDEYDPLSMSQYCQLFISIR